MKNPIKLCSLIFSLEALTAKAEKHTKQLLLIIAGLALSTSIYAQDTPEAPKAPKVPKEGSTEKALASEEELAELAKAAQNPIADMNTIPLEFNYYTGGGLGDQTLSQFLFQPVLPLPINKKWNVVSRTIVPIMSVPTPEGRHLKGIADIEEEIFFTPTQSKKILWGLGPVFSFPTATISALSTGQFALGPTAVVLAMPGKFVLGAIGNNIWRIGGDHSNTAINSFFIQPFINYNLKHAWSLNTSPSITANWNAASDQKWTVPLGIGIAKITLVGLQPLSIGLQYYHNVVRPDNVGANQVKMIASFLFPR